MKRFWILIFVFLLYGCGGGGGYSDDPNAPPPFSVNKSALSPNEALLYENTISTSADFTLSTTGDVTITGMVLKRIAGTAFIDPNVQKLDLRYKMLAGSGTSENYFTYFVHGDEIVYKNLNIGVPAGAKMDLNFIFATYKTLPDADKTLQMGLVEVSYKVGSGKVRVYNPVDLNSPMYTLSKTVVDNTIPFTVSKSILSPCKASLYENTSNISADYTVKSTSGVVITSIKLVRIAGTAFLSPNVQKLDLHYKMPSSPGMTEDHITSFVNGDEMIYKNLNINISANTTVDLNFIFTTFKIIPDVGKTLQMAMTEISYKTGSEPEKVFNLVNMNFPMYTLAKEPYYSTIYLMEGVERSPVCL